MAHRAPNPKNPEERTRDGDAARGAPTLEEREERGSRDTVHVARVRRGGGAARRSSPRGRPGPGRSSRRSRANGRDEQNRVEVFARRDGIVTARSIAKANRGRHHTHLALLGDVGGGHDAVVARRRTSAVEKGCARPGAQCENRSARASSTLVSKKIAPRAGSCLDEVSQRCQPTLALLRGVGGEMDEFHAEALRFGCLRVRPQPLVARASRASASTGPRVSDEARSPSRSWCLLSPPSPRLTLTSIPTFPRHSKGFQALLAVPSRSRGASRDGAPPRGSVADAGRTARAGQSEVRALHRPRRGLLTPHPGG